MIKNILGQECFSGFCFPTPDVEKLKTGKASSTLQYQGGIAKNRAEEERDDANARAHSKEQQLRALKAEWTVLSNHDAKIQEELVEKRVMVNALQKEPWLLFASSIMQSVSVEHRYLQCKGVCVCVSVPHSVQISWSTALHFANHMAIHCISVFYTIKYFTNQGLYKFP